jgi:hypothetical protein
LALTNSAKDLIGYLRATVLILVVWRIWPLQFPLDADISRIMAGHRDKLEEFLECACEIAQTHGIGSEMRSAVDDILAESNLGFYDQKTVDLFLSLFSGGRDRLTFSYNDRESFQRETQPIFDRILEAAVDSLLWARAEYYDYDPSGTPQPLSPLLLHFLEVVRSIAPGCAQLPATSELYLTYVSRWMKCDTVAAYLASDSQGSGLHRAAAEVVNS